SHAITTEALIGTIMALLYITGPVSVILNAMPSIAMARVSLRSMTQVFSALSKEEAIEEVKPLPDWDTVRLSNVSYHYTSEDGGFTLGPIDMEVAKGEIAFIV